MPNNIYYDVNRTYGSNYISHNNITHSGEGVYEYICIYFWNLKYMNIEIPTCQRYFICLIKKQLMEVMICFNMGSQHIIILTQTVASMNYLDFNMFNSTNMVVHFDERG